MRNTMNRGNSNKEMSNDLGYPFTFSDGTQDLKRWIYDIEWLAVRNGLAENGVASAVIGIKNHAPVEIKAEVNEYSLRGEAGSLVFSIYRGVTLFDKGDCVKIDGVCEVKKLVLYESGIRFESGIRIRTKRKSEIYIVPSSFACFLFVSVDDFIFYSGTPEFEISCYIVEDI
ncbi:MAG: hypothetical protein JKP98_16445 [Rhodobacteraceae bacterium]|nr:hypothetical protein [Paracoccaceae bacterium]